MKRNRAGFTLVEVMIAMLIMAALTVAVTRSIRTAVQNKRKLESYIESQVNLYDTLRVIKQDVERAFNYQDVFFEIEKTALMQLNQAKGQGQDNDPNDPNDPANRQPPIKLTHFLGNNDSLHFTTLNHYRMQYNAQESDQMEVGYFVENCRDKNGKESSKCLWRRSTPIIDDKVDEGGSKVVMARYVKNFRLSYRSDQENDDWVDQWRSDNRGRPDHQNKFPTFVKIEFEVGDTSRKRKVRNAKQTMVIRLQFPNNQPLLDPAKPPGADQQNPQGGTNP